MAYNCLERNVEKGLGDKASESSPSVKVRLTIRWTNTTLDGYQFGVELLESVAFERPRTTLWMPQAILLLSRMQVRGERVV